jgi:hypothetical protein
MSEKHVLTGMLVVLIVVPEFTSSKDEPSVLSAGRRAGKAGHGNR